MTDSTPKQEPPYGLRMPPDLKARVKAAAEANNRSMNAEIVSRLEETFLAESFATTGKSADNLADIDDLAEKLVALIMEKGLIPPTRER
ncbi:Arc family DNA-binding protein [Paracoccus denitrificans]|uniref:Arc family DNA-binding protein n=1 Tax=Paracoccus denitrificans TaxID=266 RepID=UPI000CECCA35|nr:Arc family DNA-binding protein [Paracoccus denitrificans]